MVSDRRHLEYGQGRIIFMVQTTVWNRAGLSMGGQECSPPSPGYRKMVRRCSGSTAGMQGEELVDVLNVKGDPVLIGSLRMQPGFLPAYHMNKENWISILLDGTAPEEQMKNLIEMSYQMTDKKRKNKPVSAQGE